MLVVIASRQDIMAQALVTSWAEHHACLLTCTDLSSGGWRYNLSAFEESTAVIGKQMVPVREITGVLTRLPCVYDQELVGIVPEDRTYVATEMTAFLLSWLSNLKCPVLNRPTPTCLSGPYWRAERWVYAAAQAGIPVGRIDRRIARGSPQTLEPSDSQTVTVTLVGKHCFGAVHERLAEHTRCLADMAQVDLLAVQFSSSEPDAYFISANIWPDLAADGVADAILAYLQDH